MKNFWSLARFFRKSFPGIRVSIRRTSHAGYWASTTQANSGVFKITIDPSLCEGGAIAYLIHEFAHVLSYHIDTHETSHGQQFGGAYCAVWAKYEEWTGARNSKEKTK